ncbi:ankyrin repeat domain-containing protein [Hydrogenophaga sp. BPS33]|uniref:ankyrin repeat domain-containing protein n=1 Tax=Hydrogenophaga sp. BPS33 TaxID=2651974 RepID=UPI00131FB8E7|nr:ankyrin repeat domain-containing protein [Hydrogenophaga sp. BPS33]QHE84385.1 hypothetical protein F9K07_05515 [Hydrogenophaga sp. BPS33]
MRPTTGHPGSSLNFAPDRHSQTTTTTTATTTSTSTDTVGISQTATTSAPHHKPQTTLDDKYTPQGPTAQLSPQAQAVLQASQEGAQQLAQAIADNDLKQVQQLLDRAPFLLNQPLDDTGTPLQMAAREGKAAIVDALLAHPGIEPNLADIHGTTPLHEAAGAGHDGIVAALLNKNANPDALDRERRAAPLHLAVAGRHINVARLLLQQGVAHLDARTRSGATAFYLAIESGQLDMAQLLRARGANINLEGTDGWRPLFAACQKGSHELLSWLLAQKPLTSLEWPHKLNPAHAVAMNTAHPQNIELLRQHMPRDFTLLLTTPDEWGNLPVFGAIECGQTEEVIASLQPPRAVQVQPLVATTYNRGRLVFGPFPEYMQSMELVSIAENCGIAMDAHGDVHNNATWPDVQQMGIQHGDFAVCHFRSYWDETLQRVMVVFPASDPRGKPEAVPLANLMRVLFNKGVLRALFMGDDVARAAQPLRRLLQYETSFHLPADREGGFLDLHYSFIGGEGPGLPSLNAGVAHLFMHDCAQGKTRGVAGNALHTRSVLPVTTLVWDGDNRELVLQRSEPLPLPALYAMQKAYVDPAKLALLFRYAHENIPDKARELLGNFNLNVDELQLGKTALHVACEAGNVEVANVLLEHGANPQKVSKTHQLALNLACSNGHAHVVQLLLERGATSPSALWQACQSGHVDVVKVLLDNGAGVDTQDIEGHTPLMFASKEGHVAVVDLLLARGADIQHTSNQTWRTALHLAAAGQPDVVALLLKKGAAVDPASRRGQTPLSIAVEYHQLDIVELLLKHGADATQRFADSTLVQMAVVGKHARIVELLLWHGASPNDVYSGGSTLLMIACANGDIATVQLLLAQGARIDTNHRNQKKETALHMACQQGHADVVQLLLQRNTNHQIKDRRGRTPLDVAKAHGRDEVVKLMTPPRQRRY